MSERTETTPVTETTETAAIADFSERLANTTGFAAPENIVYSKDGKVAKIEVPLIGGSNQDVAIRETRQLRDQVIPDTLANAPGATVTTTGNDSSN